MSAPGTTPHQPVRGRGSHSPRSQDREPLTHCELCGEPCEADPTVYDAAGYDICAQCLEDML